MQKRTLSLWQLLLLLIVTAPVVHAQTPLPALAAGQGKQATVATDGGVLRVTFQPAEWPNVAWTAATGQAWDWTGHATLAFDAANPGQQPVQINLRVDDDPTADGVHHCATGSAALAPGRTTRLYFDLAQMDSRAQMGMVGAPPNPSRAGLTAMSGGGGVNAAHIVAFQIFLHQPSAPVTVRISNLRLLPSADTAEQYQGICDGFGQFTRADWPGKVHAVSDLTTRRSEEAKELAAHPALPGRDQYGGWADGPQLPASGFFTTTERDGRWWLVTPSGHLFLSFGIDAIGDSESTIVHPRDAMFTDLPDRNGPLARFYGANPHVLYGPYKTDTTMFDFYGANLQRKYGADYTAAWRNVTAARLPSWGFNTIGNWSDGDLEAMDRVPYVATLGVGGNHARVSSGSDYWGQMHDPFDPQFAADCRTSFADEAARVKNDPWCLGYFVDNELSWSGGNVDNGRYGLAYGTLAASAGQPAKAAFLAQLQAKYADINAFNTAWGTSLASWDALKAPYQASTTPNAAQTADMAAFVYAFAKQYFTVVHDALKAADPNHLYLGCRFAGYTPEEVKAASEVCDVVSFNVYAPRLDPQHWAFTRDIGKPCIIGEFHSGALDRGMFSPGLVSEPNQAARAAMFQGYINSVVDNPAFVGAHWFQYSDEPLTGRTLDGENYNIGFVSVTDTPYPEMVAAARSVFAKMYQRRTAASLEGRASAGDRRDSRLAGRTSL